MVKKVSVVILMDFLNTAQAYSTELKLRKEVSVQNEANLREEQYQTKIRLTADIIKRFRQ